MSVLGITNHEIFTINCCVGRGRRLDAKNVAADPSETSVRSARTQHSAVILVIHSARNLNPVVGTSPFHYSRSWIHESHGKCGRGRI
jgi:hypothetical protein